ncbi:MAG: dTDP-4-dehydrorhamnose 3,5-epimerase [Ponticaulis sp.]|nr:dTDP-4-dehydrorhamnose 3,5-epimerase [Ponticaulis sp.]
MEITRLDIPEVVLLKPKKFGDDRGFFIETWNKNLLLEHGLDFDFVQDNHSLSVQKGVLRGLHFQKPPHAQDKLVRCTKGSILDVAVDIRKGSPTYGKYVSAVISEENYTQILVPKGFAHGFITLEPNTEVQYKVTAFYSPECDAGMLWNDPAIGIEWGISEDEVILSAKDKVAPLMADTDAGFVYEE